MNKRFPMIILITLLAAAGARAAGDIVFVDAQEVFKRFYKTQLAETQIQQQADDIKLEREAMELNVKDLKEEIEALRAESRDEAFSEELRRAKRNEIEEKLVELQQSEQEMIEFEKLRIEQLEKQNQRMTKKLFDEIHEAIILYSKEQGYAGVIDRSALGRSGMRVVPYADPKEDITMDILTVLNEGHEQPQPEAQEITVEQ
jgi:Skp family chaperone for outer membrane proteins